MAAEQHSAPATEHRQAGEDASARLAAAMQAPHFHLTCEEAVRLLAPAYRHELLDWAIAALRLAQLRDGLAGHELPNRNALVIGAAALFLLLAGGPRIAVPGGAA